MNHTAGAAVLQNLSMSSAGGQKESMIDKSGTAPSLSEVDHIPGEETLTVLNGTRPFVAGRTHDAGGDNASSRCEYLGLSEKRDTVERTRMTASVLPAFIRTGW